ncbi:MAG TPA: hypothetical protein VFA04_01910 [Bryobacteraceae bacterium]|jgi:hypothetical protein|nr:hypothetical protein [Bryobacteraceae bacterium]
MNCRTLRRKALLEPQALASDQERQAVAAHLLICADCRQERSERQRLREALRALPQRTAPPELAVQLRVLASRHVSQPRVGWFARILQRARLDFEDLMRPLAVPLAGGIASTIFLFAMLVPSLAVNLRLKNDIPTGLITDATLENAAPISFDSGEAVVDVTVDEEGRMVDYTIVNDRSREDNASFCQSIANYLLFTTFKPPTAFGQPVSGTIRLTFRSSYVDVRG